MFKVCLYILYMLKTQLHSCGVVCSSQPRTMSLIFSDIYLQTDFLSCRFSALPVLWLVLETSAQYKEEVQVANRILKYY